MIEQIASELKEVHMMLGFCLALLCAIFGILAIKLRKL
jgi:hypothetical protein